MARARLFQLLAFLLPVLVLAGCDAASEGVAAVTVGSVAIIHRTPVDAVVSMVSGKDCSAVRLEQGKTYCRPTEAAPDTPPYCTRSLGVVDCWKDPGAMSDLSPEVADGPRALTPEQDADRTRRWP
jgi:hypothetical protein